MILTIMRKLKYILLIIIALIAQNIYSQSGKIVIILKKPPPFLFYTEDMFKLTIINPTQETYRVYLRGISTELIEDLFSFFKNRVNKRKLKRFSQSLLKFKKI